MVIKGDSQIKAISRGRVSSWAVCATVGSDLREGTVSTTRRAKEWTALERQPEVLQSFLRYWKQKEG